MKVLLECKHLRHFNVLLRSFIVKLNRNIDSGFNFIARTCLRLKKHNTTLSKCLILSVRKSCTNKINILNYF